MHDIGGEDHASHNYVRMPSSDFLNTVIFMAYRVRLKV